MDKAANTKTMPILTVSRSQNRFLKNAKSPATIMAAIVTTMNSIRNREADHRSGHLK